MSKMSTSTRVIKNTFFLYAKMGITMFISLWTTRLILNSLGASDFGVFNIVGGAIAMLGFLNVAMASATQRFMSFNEGAGHKEKLKTVFNVSLVMHIVLAVIVGIVLAGAGIVFFNGVLNIPEERTSAAIVVYASLVLSTMVTVATVPYDAVINAHENMKYYAVVGILESLLKLAVAFACVYTLSDKLIVYGVLMAFIPFMTLGIMCVYCHKNYSECIVSPRRYYNKADMKEMASFAGWNLMGVSASMIGNYGQLVVINFFFGVLMNAAMGIVTQVQGQLLVLTNNMQKALNPVIVKKKGAQQHQEMLDWSFTGCKFAYLLFACVAIPVAVESKTILTLWLKNVPEWTELFLQLQLIRTGIECLVGNIAATLNATGKIKGLNIVNAFFFLFSLIVLCAMFTCGLPAYSLFILMILIVGLQSVNIIRLAHKICNLSVRDYLARVLFPLLITSVIVICFGYTATVIVPSGVLRMIANSLFMMLFLCMISYKVVLNKMEKEAIMNLFSKLRNGKR